jgi:hypothetical protein
LLLLFFFFGEGGIIVTYLNFCHLSNMADEQVL